MSALYNKVFAGLDASLIPLGELCEIKKGKQLNGEFLTENGQYYVMNGGLVPSGYYHAYNTPKDTISISEGGNSCGYVQYNEIPFWSGGHCYTLEELNPMISNKFLYHYLKSEELNIMATRIGSGLPNIQKKDLSRFKVKVPSLSTQQRIAIPMDALDNKMAVETKLLNALTQQKDYLLRQMFI